MIECGNCGEKNRPGAIYCRACGGRLLDPHILHKEEQKRLQISKSRLEKMSKSPINKFLKILIPIIIFVFVIYLIIQPVKPNRIPAVSDRFIKKFEEKLIRLQDSYNNSKLYRIAVTEEELNSFLKLNIPSGKELSLDILLDEGLLIYLYRTILGRPLTLTIYCGLLVEENQFAIDVLRVKFGKLPIPSFLVGYLTNSVFLKKFGSEISAPPYITSFEFSENLMYIKYDPYATIGSKSQKNPEHIDTMLKNANDLYNANDYRKAIELYKKIIVKFPDDPRIPALKSWCEEIETKLIKQ
ncbi:MAG: hypothetical protein RBU23_07205 [Candidatus Auribacterota bacterium]|jgi:hypothetical protein|nr:hypothetical protein [Candidatus Auribacterota bacterium]